MQLSDFILRLRRCSALVIILALPAACFAQRNILKQLITADSFHIRYAKVLQNPAKYHLQVIYTQVNRDSGNSPHLKTYYLCPPTKRYYYPASLVKLPLTALALEKLDSLNIPGLTMNTRLTVDSAYLCQHKEYGDTTSSTGYPSIAQYIKKMLLVSDNSAYNRIYEFVTPAYINRRLRELGYPEAEINQRLGGGCDTAENKYTNSFTFLTDNSSKVIFMQPADSNKVPIANMASNTKLGKGFYQDGKILPPRDFRYCNYIPFENMHRILLSLIFPQRLPASNRFKITPADYQFLREYMSMLPRESAFPHYSRKDYKDNFKKYNYFGTMDTITDSSIRSFNIVGRAYGFIADCSYITDFKSHTEFFLSVLMYVNAKNILNTGDYQYESLALPFMSDLGALLLKYEQKRKRKHLPNLFSFQFTYH